MTEMEAEIKHDPFASIIKFCQLTASLEARVPNCPLARESEIFLDSNDEQFSSSPDLSPSIPTAIVVVSLPDSVDQHTDDDDAVFVTPPEHHNSHLSSSEDQIPNELCAQQLRVRVSEGGLDDEPEMKRVKIDKEFDGDIVRLGETEEADNKADEAKIIVVGSGDSGAENKGDEGEIKGNEAEIIVLASGDSGAEKNKGDEADIIVLDSDAEEIMATSDLDAAGEAVTVNTVGEIGGLLSNCDAINENFELELGGNVEAIGVSRAEMPNERNVDAIGVSSAEMPNENRDSSGSLASGVAEGDIAKLEDIAAQSSLKVRLRIRGSDKAVKTPKDGKKPKDRHRSRRVRSGRRRIEEIDEFRYDGECEGRTGKHASSSGSKRLLPPSFKGKQKEVVESPEKKSGSLGLLDRLPPPSLKGKENEAMENPVKKSGSLGLQDRLPPPSLKGKENEAMENPVKKSGSLGLQDRLLPPSLEGKENEAIENPVKKSGSLGLQDRLPPPSLKGKENEAVENPVKKSGSLGLQDRLPPPSFKGKEKEAVESQEKKRGSLDLLDVLNTVFGGMNGGCDNDEDVDFLATAKRKGMTFPRPRWWPDGDEEGYPY